MVRCCLLVALLLVGCKGKQTSSAQQTGSASAGSAASASQPAPPEGTAPATGKMGWVPMDPEDAKRDCEATKTPAACGQLAGYYASGNRVAADRKKADELARAACEQKNEPYACHALGLLYETDPDPKTRDVNKAIALYEKACADGAPTGCTELGVVYAGSRAPSGADPVKAVGYVTKACELGDRMSCRKAAIMKRPR